MAIEAHIAMYFWVKFMDNVLLFYFFFFLNLMQLGLECIELLMCECSSRPC